MGEAANAADRAAVTDTLYGWCTAVDSKDWPAMRALLTDTVLIDYSSNGSIAGEMPQETWIDRLKSLHGFDKTLHMVTNVVVKMEGAEAVCSSYVNAMHFLTEGDKELNAYACGVYTHRMVRAGDGWKIKAAKFVVAGRHSGSKAFDEAFTRAREIAPSRMPA